MTITATRPCPIKFTKQPKILKPSLSAQKAWILHPLNVTKLKQNLGEVDSRKRSVNPGNLSSDSEESNTRLHLEALAN